MYISDIMYIYIHGKSAVFTPPLVVAWLGCPRAFSGAFSGAAGAFSSAEPLASRGVKASWRLCMGYIWILMVFNGF